MQPIAEDADDSGWVVGNTEVRVEQRAAQGHELFFRTVPSAITVVRWGVNENAFVLEVQTRRCPTLRITQGRPQAVKNYFRERQVQYAAN